MMRLGKGIQAILLAFFLLITASASGQPGNKIIYHFNGDLQKNIAVASDQSVIIDYSLPEVNIENIETENGIFYRISIPGHVHTSKPGKPELPVWSQLVSVPEGSDYTVKISEVRSSRINPSGKKIKGILFPVQEGETKEITQRKPEFILDKAAYATRGLIESDTVSIEPLGTVRHKNLANLYISPVRYNPRSNILEVITSMRIEISFTHSISFSAKSLFTESSLFDQSLEKGVLNYNPDEVIPGFSDQPVKMIIITDTAFREHLKPLLKWKTQKGYNLQLLFMGEGLAANSYTELKDTLTSIYNASSDAGHPPEYLLIVGDINRVPYYGTGNITDMYYGEFDGNGDYIPEMFIGRLPVADTTELKTVVRKIIQYEKFEFADTNKFYSQALATAGYDAGYAPIMNGQVKYAVSNYLTEENKIEEHHFYYPESYTAKDSIIGLINTGTSFINYSGHGDATGWLHLNIKVPDISSFHNKNMYPFIISNACRTAQFSIASSFGNRLVVSDDKGAIGFIGCSNDSYWDEDFYWAVGTGTISDDPTYEGSGPGFYDRLFHTHGEAASDWYYTMGQISYAGNLAVSASTSSRKKYYWETYNLVGDPSIIPIIGRPDSFNIELPDTLPNGISSLSLDIPPFAYAAISHFDTLWDASFSSPSGSLVLVLPEVSDDSCMIVISGQNKVPLIKTIYFSDIDGSFVNLKSSSINDSSGNGNGVADFGETFYLSLEISNLGLTDSEELYAKISSTSGWISIINDSVFIGTLPARSDILLDTDFEITISGDIPDMEVITINLVLKDLNSEKFFTIDICAHAPDLNIISCIIDDSVLGNGDFIADPGETFKLIFKVQNEGTSDISGQFSIMSFQEDITILEPSVKSGILKFGEITEIPISVKLSETIISGSFVSVSATLDCAPYIVDKDFAFSIGRIRESFEAESFNIFPWINISSVPWITTSASSYDGTIAARSGPITHNGSTILTIRNVYTENDSVKFFYKVSSEAGYDFFSFRLNGTEVIKKSGEVPWTGITLAVPAGLNKMEWLYKKDESVTSGADCAWIDMIDFAGQGSVSYIQNDLEVAKIVTPVQKDQFGKETIAVKVLNIGKDTINGFYMAYQVNGNYPVQQFFDNVIAPYSDSVEVSFGIKADLSKYGFYKIASYGVDNNDDYILNDTAWINLENTEINESLSVFPNPFNDHLTIFINSRIAERINISFIDIKGAKLYEVEKYLAAGKNEIFIPEIRLIPSLYYLNIRGAVTNKTIPVLKINR